MKVKSYKSRWWMQRSIGRMAENGYVIEHQSGSFSHWWKLAPTGRVVVTFRLQDERPADVRPVVG